jgi:hypothetical protein
MHRTFLYAVFVFLIFPSLAAAAYTPGQTLDPNCLPSDPTCLVINTNVVADNFTATSTTATSSFAGGFNVANGGLLYDRSTRNLGIGTTSPSSLLSVAGDGYFTGNIGIGLVPVNPGFEAKGTGGLALRLTDTISNSAAILQTLADGSARLSLNDSNWGGHRWDIGVGPQFATASTTLAFRDVSSGGVRMVIDGSGNVGIGTTSPTALLGIQGSIGVSNSHLYLAANGTVGIGTASPTATLHVKRLAGKITGTVTSSGTAVTGVSTLFTTEVAVGDTLQVGNLTGTVASITDNTHLTLSAGFSHDVIVAANASINPTGNIARFATVGGTDSLLVTSNQGIILQGDNTSAVLDTTNLLANADFAANAFTSWTAGGGWDASTGAAVYTATNAAILNAASVKITNGGIGYTVGDVLTLGAGSGDATITVSTVSAGKVTAFTLSNAGTGYNDTMTGTATGGTGSGFTYAVKQVVAGNTLTQTASPAMISGQSYQLTLVKSGGTQGAVTISLGGVTLATTQKLSAATQTYTFQATGNTALTITPTSDFNGTLDTFTLTHFENTVSPLITFNNAAGTAALEMRTSGTTNTFVGLNAGKRNTSAVNNSAFGVSALAFNTTGANNSAFGLNALAVTTTGGSNSAFGSLTLVSNTTGTSNNAFGSSALNANTTGASNNAFGASALAANTTGLSNSAFGTSALSANTTGGSNSAFGSAALTANTTGTNNSAFGLQALFNNTTGSNNNAFGQSSLFANTTGTSNNALGVSALAANTTGTSNNAVGVTALTANTTGTSNDAFGLSALAANTTGASNVAVGREASDKNISATSTVAVGYHSAYGNNVAYNAQGYTMLGYQSGNVIQTGADWNTFIGYSAGNLVTTGADNIIIGAASTTANSNLTTGSQNILIGSNIRFPSATANGQLNIQNILFGINNSAIGSTVSSGSIGIGTSSPTTQFQTTGSVRFSNFGAGTLQTDANGNLSVSSDERLKNVQGAFARGLAEIELINPILYQWKPETGFDTSTTYAGFSAQNVQSAIPEAVGQDGHGYLTLQDRPLIAAAVNAIKSIAGISDDFRVHLTAWLGDASNGIPTIFAQVGNFDTTNSKTTNTQTLCVDGQCLTKSDVHALLQMVQQQNGIGGSSPSGGPVVTPSPIGTSTDSEGTSTPAIPESPVDASSSSSVAL